MRLQLFRLKNWCLPMPRTHESVIRQRKAIIRLFPRTTLEKLASFEKPHLANTVTLRDNIAIRWPEERIRQEFEHLLGLARKVD